MAKFKGLSVTLCVGTPLYPCDIVYHRGCGLYAYELFEKSLGSPLRRMVGNTPTMMVGNSPISERVATHTPADS